MASVRDIGVVSFRTAYACSINSDGTLLACISKSNTGWRLEFVEVALHV